MSSHVYLRGGPRDGELILTTNNGADVLILPAQAPPLYDYNGQAVHDDDPIRLARYKRTDERQPLLGLDAETLAAVGLSRLQASFGASATVYAWSPE